MKEQQLEQVIREYIQDIYKSEYIGKIWITKLPIGYIVKFGMNVPEKPHIIYAELDDKEFLKFIKQELKSSRFRVFYGKLSKTMPPECNIYNRTCSCNDKR